MKFFQVMDKIGNKCKYYIIKCIGGAYFDMNLVIESYSKHFLPLIPLEHRKTPCGNVFQLNPNYISSNSMMLGFRSEYSDSEEIILKR